MDKWLFEQINYLCHYIKYIASNVLIFPFVGAEPKNTFIMSRTVKAGSWVYRISDNQRELQ